jgi:hypothetical protein
MEHLPSMPEALGSISVAERKGGRREGEKERKRE